MSHTAVDSDVLFWFIVALTVLLGMLISVVVRTPPETVGSPQPPGAQPSRAAPAGARHVAAGHRARRLRAPCHGAHRVDMSTVHGRSPAGGTGRHRAGVH